MGLASYFNERLEKYRAEAALKAIENDKPDKLRKWLATGISPQRIDDMFMVPRAIERFNGESLQVLIEHKARIDVNAIGRCMLPGYLPLLAQLVKAGVNVEHQTSEGKTFAVWAIDWNNPAGALLLLDAGVDVNTPDKLGKTALHYAARQGYTDLCDQLINRGAKIDARDNEGNTALNDAGNADVEERLLKRGAAPLAADAVPFYKQPPAPARKSVEGTYTADTSANPMDCGQPVYMAVHF